MNQRIQVTDTLTDVAVKLSGGNPGAVRVCADLIRQGAQIDPDAFGGGLSSLLSLDKHAVYGADIWMLYKDVCKENLTHMVAALRAVQLGLFSESHLKHAIQNRGEGLDPIALFDAVCERLPNFAKANALEAAEIRWANQSSPLTTAP